MVLWYSQGMDYVYTTMKVRSTTKTALDGLKIHPRETYDDVLTRLIDEHERRAEAEGVRRAG